MFIEDEGALRVWLIATLEPLCDAEPEALARYVLALISKDKPLDKLRENCIDRLDVFLCQETTNFVDQLFDVIRNRRYLSEGKKENVQPKVSESRETHEPPQRSNSTKDEDTVIIESHPIPTTTSRTSSVKRHQATRVSNTTDNASSSHKRHLKSSSPPAKRKHRSYSHSSDSSPSPHRSSSKTTDFSYAKQIPCTDSNEHSSSGNQKDSSNVEPDPLANQDVDKGAYFSYDVATSDLDQQYNPEEPELGYNSHPMPTMYHQRTLVTVITNPEPLPNDPKSRQHDSNYSRNGSNRSVRTKRHVTTSFQPDQREHSSNIENRSRKRPWQKPNNTSGTTSTLEIRKIPPEFNTISKLNEHFSKFGTVTNVQISYDGSPDSALIAYGTHQEAETAHKNPEPLFNNRFIKIFWHKGTNSTPTETRPVKKPTVAPHPTKLHWSKTAKPVANSIETTVKKSTTPAAPSMIKKEAAKKAAIEIRRKKTGLLEEQIQQQKFLLKKFETAETSEEKESIRALMKQIDATIITLNDSLVTTPGKAVAPPKLSEQDLLKHRAQVLKKKLEALRAKTSEEMRRAIANTLETKLTKETTILPDEEDKKLQLSDPIDDELQLLDS